MVFLWCPLLEADAANDAAIVQVDVEPSMSVEDLNAAIDQQLTDANELGPIEIWHNYVARGNGAWLTYSDVRMLPACTLTWRSWRVMPPYSRLDSHEWLGLDGSTTTTPPPSDCIHILIRLPKKKKAWTHEEKLESSLLRATQSGQLPSRLECVDVDTWGIGDCGSSVALRALATIFSDLPTRFYVREEILMVWRVFKNRLRDHFEPSSESGFQSNVHQLVLVGSSGVGKTSVLLLMCVDIAMKLDDRVLILQKQQKHYGRIYLLAGGGSGSGKVYMWDKLPLQDRGSTRLTAYDRFVEIAENATLKSPSSSSSSRRLWLCADGMFQREIQTMLPSVRFDIIALPHGSTYLIQPHDHTRVTQCLVPFWSESDVKTAGKHSGIRDDELDLRFKYAGGNVGWFLKGLTYSREAVYSAVDRIAISLERGYPILCYKTSAETIALLTTTEERSVEGYVTPVYWKHEVTSSLARSLLPPGFEYE